MKAECQGPADFRMSSCFYNLSHLVLLGYSRRLEDMGKVMLLRLKESFEGPKTR